MVGRRSVRWSRGVSNAWEKSARCLPAKKFRATQIQTEKFWASFELRQSRRKLLVKLHSTRLQDDTIPPENMAAKQNFTFKDDNEEQAVVHQTEAGVIVAQVAGTPKKRPARSNIGTDDEVQVVDTMTPTMKKIKISEDNIKDFIQQQRASSEAAIKEAIEAHKAETKDFIKEQISKHVIDLKQELERTKDVIIGSLDDLKINKMNVGDPIPEYDSSLKEHDVKTDNFDHDGPSKVAEALNTDPSMTEEG